MRPEARRLVAATLVALLAAGAGAQAAEGRFERGRLGTRDFRLYVPALLADAAAAPPATPLVLALHGCWQTPEDFARATRLNAAAERRGLLVLYPAQPRQANPSRCWNWFTPARRDGGEAGELLALVAHVARRHAVARVLAVGFSAGAFMAVNLACVAPDVVTAVGASAGGPYRCATDPLAVVACLRGEGLRAETAATACRAAMGGGAAPPRASLWHGDGDVVVSPAALTALAGMFARLHGAGLAALERRADATRALYRDAAGRAVVETWLVTGMGHAWSGGDPRATHTFPSGPDATRHLLDFLLEAPDGGVDARRPGGGGG